MEVWEKWSGGVLEYWSIGESHLRHQDFGNKGFWWARNATSVHCDNGRMRPHLRWSFGGQEMKGMQAPMYEGRPWLLRMPGVGCRMADIKW